MKLPFTPDEKLLAEAKELTKIEYTQQLLQYAIKSMKGYEAVGELLN